MTAAARFSINVCFDIAHDDEPLGEIEVCIDYTCTKGDPGQLYGPPEKCWQPEAPEVEFVSAEVCVGYNAIGDAIWRPAPSGEAIERAAEHWCSLNYDRLVDHAEQNGGPDPDDERERERDDHDHVGSQA